MRQELLSRIKPMTEKYIEDLLKLEKELQEMIRFKEDEILKLHDEGKILREERKQNDKKAQIKQQALDEEIGKCQNLQSDLGNEISQYNKLNRDLKIKIDKKANEVQGAEDDRSLTSKEFEKQQTITQTHRKKLELLKIDEEKLRDRNMKLSDREKGIETRDRNSIIKEDRLIERERKCSEWELDLKNWQKRIDFQKKKYEL